MVSIGVSRRGGVVSTLILLASCANVTEFTIGSGANKIDPSDMTVRDARATIRKLPQFGAKIDEYPVTSAVPTSTKVIIRTNTGMGRSLTVPLGNLSMKILSGNSASEYFGFHIFFGDAVKRKTTSVHLELHNQYEGIPVVKAFYALDKAASEHPSMSAADFGTAVRSYRQAQGRLPLPEDARRFKVQAEKAIQDKDFDTAADLYAKALEIAPWWPEGHFNRAVILAEIEDFELAVLEMKRYLLLVPSAPDARAAQDKIYEWESKTTQSN